MSTKKLKPVLLIVFSMFVLTTFFSCKKDKFLTQGGEISFSTDTLKFDTVFTTVGSVTRSFKLYNTNSKRIKIDEIKLEGGASSPFRMNIDGEPTKNIQGVEIAPNDSIYVFVALTVNPTSGTLPFLVNEKVQVTLNGNMSELPLEAYGQDAHYVVDSILDSQTWTNDKPYVIVHSALVDSAQTLTIQKGCRIYMHADSKLYVAGTLRVFGTKSDSVIFQGDRLDRDYFGYKDYPGEWRGIHFLGTSQLNTLNYCIVKNAGLTDAAIYVQPPTYPIGGNFMLEMNKCVVANSAGYGILAFNTRMNLNNCLVHTCGLQNLAIVEGGTYQLNFCTIATYGGIGINHAQQPSAVIFNYRDISLTEYVGADLKATINNCIIDGSLEDEIVFNAKGSGIFDVTVNNCAFKRKNAFPAGTVSPNNTLLNQDPQFVDENKWDFHLQSTSPLKGAGVSVPIIIDDLDDMSRLNPPSIGCYEAN